MTRKEMVTGLLVLAIVLVGCQTAAQPTTEPVAQSQYVPIVSVTGEIVPAVWATLSHETGGKVVKVLVEPGDQVAAGAPLILLDIASLELALEMALQQVAAQEALLQQLRNGSTEQVIARADRDNAYQIAQAETALRAKQKQLEQAQAQDPADDVAAVQARIKQLQAQMVQVRAQDPGSEVTLAQIELERAKIVLDDTQDEYNKALDRPWEDQEIRDAWAKQLEQVQLNYRAAQAQLDRANAAQRAHALGLDVLDAQLEEAQTLLAQARDAAQAYQITLDILSADISAAELQLRYLRAWDNPYRDQATAQEIAQAEALLAQAVVSVRQIEQQLSDATMVAPFGGTVGAVNARLGERVLPGQPLLTLGDLDTLRVETTDLDEIDVVRVSIDQQVDLTFDALPERVFKGRVTRISPKAESGTGGVNYTVVIDLEQVDPVLRWGMTAFVDIEIQ